MSQYFEADGRTLWNPATRVARLFVAAAGTFVPYLDRRPHGIGPETADEYEIDLPVYGAFVNALVDRRLRTSHPVSGALLDGFLPTAIVLARHGGIRLTGLEAPPADRPWGAYAAGRLEEAARDVAWSLPD
ncbi:DUF6086 family protein [Streptomyces sp. NPDC055287]